MGFRHLSLAIGLTVVVVVALLVGLVYWRGVNTTLINEDWEPLGYVEESFNVGGARFIVSLEAYEVVVDDEELVGAMRSLSEYCINWSSEQINGSTVLGSPKCGLEPRLIEEYARNGKLAVLAVVARVSNSGPTLGRVGGPGPYCGYSYNIEHLKDPAREDPLKQHYQPLSFLYYKVEDGEIVLGYGGFCQLALLLHPLYPGESIETIYGFVVVRPAELALSVDPALMADNREEWVRVNMTVKIR